MAVKKEKDLDKPKKSAKALSLKRETKAKAKKPTRKAKPAEVDVSAGQAVAATEAEPKKPEEPKSQNDYEALGSPLIIWGSTFIAFMLLFLVVVYIAKGSSSGSISSPSETIQKYYHLLMKKKFAEAYDFISTDSHRDIPKGDYLRMMKELSQRFELQEVKTLKVAIKGSEAEVSIKVKELDREEALTLESSAIVKLVLEKDQWRIKWPEKKKDK